MLLGGTQTIRCFAQPRLADGQRIAGIAQPFHRLGRGAGKRIGFRGDCRRPRRQLGHLGAERILAVFENGALRGSAIAPLAPRFALRSNRGEALLPRLVLVRQPVEDGAGLGLAPSRARRLGPRRFQRCSSQFRSRQQFQRPLGFGGLFGNITNFVV